MNRKGEQFAGLTVAITTPFTLQGEVDYPALDRIIDFQVEQGTECVAPVGTTGESPTLDHDEHRAVIRRVVERAAGRIKVMAGTGSNSTREAIALTRFAKEAGVDGALVVAPYYNKPTQQGFLKHFLAIADAVDVPMVMYNIPGRCGANINPETVNQIGEHPNVVAIKEATGSMDQASQILSGSALTVLSGDDSLTLPLMSLGGSGIVSVVGNIVPKDIQSVVRLFAAGKIGEAQAAHRKLFALCKDMLNLATNPIPIKAAMKLLGRGNGVMRLPLCGLEPGQEAKLRSTLTAYGLQCKASEDS